MNSERKKGKGLTGSVARRGEWSKGGEAVGCCRAWGARKRNLLLGLTGIGGAESARHREKGFTA